MSDYHGDIAAAATLRFTFNTSLNGAPITLAGTPSLAAYKDGGLTQSTAGLALSVDHDGVVGLHMVTVTTSADAFYAAGSDFAVVLAAGTVNGVSVVGTEVGNFSMEHRIVSSVIGSVGTVQGSIGGDVQGNVWGNLFGNVESDILGDLHGLAANVITATSIAGDAITEANAAVLAAIAALNNIATGAAMTLTAGERTLIATALLDLANGIETGFTLRESQRLQLSAAVGKLTGPAPGTAGTVNIRDINDTKNRISATVDVNSQRTAVTKDVS